MWNIGPHVGRASSTAVWDLLGAWSSAAVWMKRCSSDIEGIFELLPAASSRKHLHAHPLAPLQMNPPSKHVLLQPEKAVKCCSNAMQGKE